MTMLAIDIWFILEKVILIATIIGLSFFIAMYTTYAERKVAAWLPDQTPIYIASSMPIVGVRTVPGPLVSYSHWPTEVNYFSRRRSFP